MMKKLMLIAILALVGCNGTQHSSAKASDGMTQVDDLLGSLNSTPNGRDDQSPSGYAGKIKHAVDMKLIEPEKWRGKECTVRVVLQRNGSITQANAEAGDKDFCIAAVDAVKNAAIPPAPNDKVYQMFKNAVFDFKR
ncbi:cell envelope integrity protein TolA [Enterobacteriaceae bacterium 89]|nr:cell envelope integrity protein TolA [Enterobacteriaceae bacterium 89]